MGDSQYNKDSPPYHNVQEWTIHTTTMCEDGPSILQYCARMDVLLCCFHRLPSLTQLCFTDCTPFVCTNICQFFFTFFSVTCCSKQTIDGLDSGYFDSSYNLVADVTQNGKSVFKHTSLTYYLHTTNSGSWAISENYTQDSIYCTNEVKNLLLQSWIRHEST